MKNLIALLVLLACPTVQSAPDFCKDIAYPDTRWQSTSVPAFNIDQDELDEVLEYVSTLNTRGLHVSVCGREIISYGEVESTGYIASVRKGILAMLYGKYVKDGTIDLDATLEDLGIDDNLGLLAVEKRAKVRHLLQARSGVYHPASNGGDSSADAPPRGSQEPGTYFLYNNWDFNAAGGVFEQLTGKSIYQSLNDQFAVPLGFEDFDLGRHRKSGDRERSRFPAYHMHLSARDLARLGLLMLSEGQWKDKQLIDSEWVAEITAIHTPNAELNPPRAQRAPSGFGYMWRPFDRAELPPEMVGGYMATGSRGQFIVVLPKIGLVVGHKTTPDDFDSVEDPESFRVRGSEMFGILGRLARAIRD